MIRDILLDIRWGTFVIRHKIKVRICALNHLLFAPRVPTNPDNKVLIHLGCGDISSPGFINVDARPAPHVHYVRDVTDLSIFPDNYADLIYACHVLEHIRHTALRPTLWEWRRILKSGGTLRLSVPDFDKLLHIYESSSRDMTAILCLLMGGQDYEQNAHYCVFNGTYLADKLREMGFKEVRQWAPDHVSHHDFQDSANINIVRNGVAFPVSLNLEGTK